MSIVENIGAGLMMMGLVLGAMTGTIAMLLIPVAAGTLVFAAASWYKHMKYNASNTRQVQYPPYGY